MVLPVQMVVICRPYRVGKLTAKRFTIADEVRGNFPNVVVENAGVRCVSGPRVSSRETIEDERPTVTIIFSLPSIRLTVWSASWRPDNGASCVVAVITFQNARGKRRYLSRCVSLLHL